MRVHRLVTFLFCLFISTASTIDAEDSNTSVPTFEKLRQDILQAQNPSTVGKAYERLFEFVGTENIDLLKNDPNTGIALQAAWETVDNPQKLPKKRFIDLLEERVGIAAPLRWKTVLMLENTLFGRRTLIDIKKIHPELNIQEYTCKEGILLSCKSTRVYRNLLPPITYQGPFTYGDIRIQQGITTTKLTTPKDVVRLQKNLIKSLQIDSQQFFYQLLQIPGSYSYVAVETDKSRLYIAFYGPMAKKYPLYCIDIQSSKVLWKTAIWACADEYCPFISGFSSHEVTLKISNGFVVVFGGPKLCYVEGLDKNTGNCKFRFSEGYYPSARR